MVQKDFLQLLSVIYQCKMAAAMDLARRYLNGNFVKIDEEEAKKWALKAFEETSDEELDDLTYL